VVICFHKRPVQNASGNDTYRGCSGTISYTWTWTDCAGFSNSWTFTYTVSPPVWSAPVSTGTTVACPALAVAPGATDITDNCGRTISGVLTSQSADVPCYGTMWYQYTYTACDQTTQTYTYTYTISAPVWSAPVSTGTTVVCPASAVAPGATDITDNCGRTISGVLTSQSADVTCNGTMWYQYTYTACDQTTQTYTYTYTSVHQYGAHLYQPANSRMSCISSSSRRN